MKTMTLYRPNLVRSALNEFDRHISSFFEDNYLSPSDGILRNSLMRKYPSVNVRETDKHYILEAELPGYDENGIELHVENNVLTIESKKEETKTEKNEDNYLLKERHSYYFNRSFGLPSNADPEDIKAVFKNGILLLEINKKSEAVRKQIQIKSE